MLFTPEIHADPDTCNLRQVSLDAHLHQEVIYSACFHENREEMRLLIKSSKVLRVLRVPRRKLFKWPRSSTMEMRAVAAFYLSVYPHFGMLLSRRPASSLTII